MSQKLSVFLIKSGLIKAEDIIKSDNEIKEYEVIIIPEKKDTQKGNGTPAKKGKFFFKTSFVKTPSWYSLFGNSIDDFDPNNLKTKNISAVLLLEVKNRVFALTFGYGRSLLNSDSWEEQFGLRVCMNSIDKDDFRVVERKNLDTMITHNKTQMNRKCSIDEFAIDYYNILLKAVSGEAKDKKFAKKLTGADSLSINCEVSLQTLPNKCAAILSAYSSDDYKQEFPWMENLREVPKNIIDDLNNQMMDNIRQKNFEKVFLAVPEMIEWSNFSGFQFKKDAQDSNVDILIEDFYQTLRNVQKLSVNTLKNSRHVYAVDSNTDNPIKMWSVYKCLNCEIQDNDQRYILTDGKWFAVSKSFVDEIEKKIKSIKKYQTPLIPAQKTESEKEYNIRLSKSIHGSENLDAKNIQYGGGHSKIEFCDVYSKNKELFHVKRYSGSAVLSHLFSQGYNSAKLLLRDQVFRQGVNAILPPTLHLPSAVPIANEYSIVFGIISKEANKVPSNLPFFSKLTLERTVEELQFMGVNVYVSGIQIQ